LWGRIGGGSKSRGVALKLILEIDIRLAAELIDDLSAAFRDRRLTDALAVYTHPGVLIIDEVGYLTYGTDAANMLFHVVNDRHRKKRAMIFTTNKALNATG
jgi:DNA replication protein DnaC